MNKIQRSILWVSALIVLLMLIYPPFCIFDARAPYDMQYSWAWSAPSEHHAVHAILLLTQWVGVLIICWLLVFAAKSANHDARCDSAQS